MKKLEYLLPARIEQNWKQVFILQDQSPTLKEI